MQKPITYRSVRPGEEQKVCALVVDSFNEFVGIEYLQAGVEEFLKYARADALAQRSAADHLVLVATLGHQIVGMIEMRQNEHISMLFVDRQFHRRGVAKELLRRSLEIARKTNPNLPRVSVNSSRYAVSVYEKLGFSISGPEQTVNGILFVPMVLELA